MPQLDPTWFLSQLFWLCICFGLLYFVVSKFLAPQMAEVAKRRQDKIDGYIKQAQDFNDQAKAVLSDYEKSFEKAKNNADKKFLQQKEEIESLVEKKQEDANAKIAAELKKSENNINKIKAEAIKEVDKVAKTLSKEIIKKLEV